MECSDTNAPRYCFWLVWMKTHGFMTDELRGTARAEREGYSALPRLRRQRLGAGGRRHPGRRRLLAASVAEARHQALLGYLVDRRELAIIEIVSEAADLGAAHLEGTRILPVARPHARAREPEGALRLELAHVLDAGEADAVLEFGVARLLTYEFEHTAQLPCRVAPQVLVAHDQQMLQPRQLLRPAVHEIDDLGQARILVHDEVEDVDLRAARRVAVQVHLVGPHAELPLMELRHGHVRGLAYEKHHLLAVEIPLVVQVIGEIAQVIVVREKNPRDAFMTAMQIVEADERRRSQPEAQLEESR